MFIEQVEEDYEIIYGSKTRAKRRQSTAKLVIDGDDGYHGHLAPRIAFIVLCECF